MKYKKTISHSLLFVVLNLVFSQYSYAHMMVAQHGTLNIIDNSIFMVLSLPVSAFKGVDDDNDSKLSIEEFTTHRSKITKIIHNKVILKDKSGKLDLQGMILSPVMSHHAVKTPSSQLIIMGRFTLVDPNSTLQYRVELFGHHPDEALLEVIATRQNDERRQVIQLSPKNSQVTLFNE